MSRNIKEIVAELGTEIQKGSKRAGEDGSRDSFVVKMGVTSRDAEVLADYYGGDTWIDDREIRESLFNQLDDLLGSIIRDAKAGKKSPRTYSRNRV